MPDETLNLNQVTDDQLNNEIKELNSKAERTEEENQRLTELKKERQTRYQKRIDELTSERKLAEYKYQQEMERRRQLEEELEKLRQEREKIVKTPPSVTRETVTIGDKVFFTDRALQSMIESGEMTEAEAYQHQQQRIEETAAQKAYMRLKEEQQKAEEERIRREDAEAVLREYPHFDKNHPNFNPEDPLYKEATRIYQMGYWANPRGLSEAIKEAKRILRMTDARIDNSNNLNLKSPSVPASNENKKKEIELTEYEKEIAIKQYTRGDVINPATGRPYTEAEAIAKAKKAKEMRLQSRRVL